MIGRHPSMLHHRRFVDDVSVSRLDLRLKSKMPVMMMTRVLPTKTVMRTSHVLQVPHSSSYYYVGVYDYIRCQIEVGRACTMYPHRRLMLPSSYLSVYVLQIDYQLKVYPCRIVLSVILLPAIGQRGRHPFLVVWCCASSTAICLFYGTIVIVAEWILSSSAGCRQSSVAHASAD